MHGFLEGVLDPVREALAQEARVLVAVSDVNACVLRDALGADAGRVRFVDVLERGRNPARALSLWLEFAHEPALGGDGALGVSELVWPGRSAAELEECERHEALLGLALGDGPAWRLLCAYNRDALGEGVIEAAKSLHPLCMNGHARHPPGSHTHAHRNPRPFAGSLAAPQGKVGRLAFTGESLRGLRHALSAWAQANGLDQERSSELVLAASELAANSVRYAGGRGTLRYWREDGALVCEVRDAGHIQAPLVGRVRPAPDACEGRGLWLVNQLCDLVQIRSSRAGNVVRVYKRVL